MDWNADPTILYRSINRIILVCNSVDCVRDFLDVRIVASIEEYSIYSIWGPLRVGWNWIAFHTTFYLSKIFQDRLRDYRQAGHYI